MSLSTINPAITNLYLLFRIPPHITRRIAGLSIKPHRDSASRRDLLQPPGETCRLPH
jgi:hypothetical protein